MTITANQMTDGSHTFKIRWVEEVNRGLLFISLSMVDDGNQGYYKCPIISYQPLRFVY
jgi:hypothetical protein